MNELKGGIWLLCSFGRFAGSFPVPAGAYFTFGDRFPARKKLGLCRSRADCPCQGWGKKRGKIAYVTHIKVTEDPGSFRDPAKKTNLICEIFVQDFKVLLF